MKEYFFLDKNNIQFGPFKKDELRGKITKESFVWREGLKDWIEAKNLIDFNDFFSINYQIDGEINPSFQQSTFDGKVSYFNNSKQEESSINQPNTYKTWSIFSIIFFLTPLGIAGLIMGNLSKKKWKEKKYNEAYKFSRLAKKMNVIALCVGIPLIIIYIIYYVILFSLI